MTGADTAEFLSRFEVVPAGEDHFTGTCYPGWPGRAFGGQLAAQSLHAASLTAPEGMDPWSTSIYFHAPVRSNEPIDYEVVHIKDGKTTATRQVRVQQDGKLRATSMSLFGRPGEGPTHSHARPNVTAPEDLPPVERIIHPSVVPPDADFAALGYPTEALVELRVVPHEAVEGAEAALQNPVWMRVIPPLPQDALVVAMTVCYLSDITLGTTALEPHGGRDGASGLQLGAIELALWFTGAGDLNAWSLFSQETSFAGSGHGLSHGLFYDAHGRILAVAGQNALMRFAQ